MTDTTPAAPAAPAAPDGNGGDDYSPPDDCGVDLLDNLKCEAKGIEEQAKYNAQHATELKTARTSYDTARTQYRKAREAATKTYKDLGTQLDKLLEQLRCLIDDKTKVRWLDQAFDIVDGRLAECPGQEGCYLDDDCDFDDLVDCPPDDVPGAIKKIEERVAAAKKVFDDLVQEPTELPKRVTAVQNEVNEIVKAMATDSRSVDFKVLYARARVAKARRDNLWRGFEDTNSYVDCLCRALLCQLKGYDAVSQLTRRQAVDACYAESDAARCAWLREHTDDAVMEEYEKIKAAHKHGYGGAPQGGGDYDPGQQGGGDYDPGQQGGDDYSPGQQGGGDYPTQQGGGDYPTQQGGGDYPSQQGGDDYPSQQGGDGDYGSEGYGSSEEGAGYGPKQGGGGPSQGGGQQGGGGYGGKKPPPDQGRGQGYERRGRPGLRRPPRG